MKKYAVLIMILFGCGRNGIDGKDGAPGVNGKDGMNGTSGKDGTTMSLDSLLFCSHLEGNLGYIYRITTFSNNVIFSQCSIITDVAEFGNSQFFTKGQNGYDLAHCQVTFDATDGTSDYGYWVFTRNPNQVVFHNQGSTNDGHIISFSDSDCTTSIK